MLQSIKESKFCAIAIPVFIVMGLLLATADYVPIRDDFYHRQLLLGDLSLVEAMQSLFSFSDNLQGFAQPRWEGQVPWWTAQSLEINFWRPLAALTHWLDYQLWPDNWVAMHLHSMLWFVIACILFGLLAVGFNFSGGLLWLVVFLFVFDPNHLMAIGWVANRNIIIATVFGLLALLGAQRWQQQGANKWLVICGVAYGLALLSAEAGVAVFGLLLALLLCLQQPTIGKRLGVVVMLVGITLAWRLLYQSMGYGVQGSGMYLDPIQQWREMGEQLWVNGSTLLFEQSFRLPTFAMSFAPATLALQAWINTIALALLVLLLWPLLKTNKIAALGLVGGALAVVPMVAASISGGRLLFIPGIGICLFMALWYYDTFTSPLIHSQHKLYGYVKLVVTAVAIIITLTHTVLGWYYKAELTFSKQASITLPKHMDLLGPEVAQKNVLLLNPPVLFELMYLPLIADFYQLPKPMLWLSLVPGRTNFTVKKERDNLLVVSNPNGLLHDDAMGWRQADAPLDHQAYLFARVDGMFGRAALQSQQVIETALANIIIEKTNQQGDPTEIRYQLKEPLNSKNWVIFAWDWEQESFKQLPELPATLTLAGPF